MRRCAIVLGLLTLAVAACSRSSTTTVVEAPRPLPAPPQPFTGPGEGTPGAGPPAGPGMVVGMSTPATPGPAGPPPLAQAPAPATPEEQQARYETLITQAAGLMADKKWSEALAAFEAARLLADSELAQAVVERLRQRVDQEATAEQTAASIQTVLDEGKPDEAAKLAAEALGQFGQTDAADRLARLKRQADALAALQINDRKARFERFRAEYEAALKENNKRAALAALEQAAQNGEDESLTAKYDELLSALGRYDRLRERAAQLRKEPGQLDEAVAALKEAQEVWDNLAVRQELEELQLAQQYLRPRLGVADFDVRGDVGLPQAGAFIADELLPAFKRRYDLVDRGRLGQAVDELKLNGQLSDDEDGRRQLSRAVQGLRYLVVGSVAPVAGLTVHARLVDVETGLVVQTARLVAATPEELTEKLPQLADELMMDDAQKLALEQERARRAAEVEVFKPANLAELPPPPELPKDVPAPAPVVPPRPKAPPLGEAAPEQFVRRFDQLPGPPAPGQVIPLPVLLAERERELRGRALFVALELGDNLFRRGRFREAFARFEFALSLAPDNFAVRRRVERCRPLVPPAPPVVVRPRVALLDFVVIGNPAAVPPFLSYWTPEYLAPYLAPELVSVDRAEMAWWMGRLGLTQLDLLSDPVARLYLGRALNVRYFLFGNVVQTGSFDVTTYLIDAEYGFLTSSARVHVLGRRNPWDMLAELKLRLGELAWLTKMSPEQRRRVEDENAQWAILLNDIRFARERRKDYNRFIELVRKGLALRPNNVELLAILRDAERARREEEFLSGRLGGAQRLREELITLSQRQRELALQAEAARLRAEQQTVADRQRLEAQRRAAAEEFVRRAKFMAQAKRFTAAVSLYESAAALRPNDDQIYRELATARAGAEAAARAEQAEALARREAELRRQREAELARARAQLDAERRQREAAEMARRRAADERDRSESERLLGLAQQFSARQQYDQAVAAAQKAQRLRPTPEADRLVSQLLIELARSNAEKRGAAARAELERQLAAEREARAAAEAEATRNRQLYESLLAQGQQSLRQEKFDEAREQFLRARQIHETDVVLTGLRQASAGKARLESRLAEERRKQEELKRQNDALKSKLADAQAALAARRVDRAVSLYQEARKIAPTNVDVLSGLARAEQAREQELVKARRDGEEKARRETFQRLLASGRANLEAKRYESAALALGEAVRLDPGNKEAKDALAEAQAKVNADAAAKARLERNAAEYRRGLGDGRRALAARQYDQALSEFLAAKQANPTDRAVDELIQEARKLKAEADRARAAEVQAKRLAAQKSADLEKAIERLKTALAAGKLDAARAAHAAAVKLDAGHPEVIAAAGAIRKLQDAATADQPKDKPFADLLARARAALQAKKNDEAAEAVAAALKLKPGDAGALALQSQVTQARADAAADVKKQELVKLLAQARTAFQAKRYDDASKAVMAALQLSPQDREALTLKGQVEIAKKDAVAAAPKRQEFSRQMAQGRAALQAKRFADAAKAFETALTLSPDDAEARRLLAEAKRGAASSPPMPPKPAAKPPEYARQMQQGAALERSGRHDQALAAYKAALKAVPGDADAQKKADFCQSMVDGTRALQQRKFADAQAAYEAALKLFPNDPAAKAGLQRAKAGK